MTRLAIRAAALLALGLAGAGTARAVDQVPAADATGRNITVDVWINKEEGGVYRSGESMRVFFRSSADAYLLVYNIDTDGYIHLVYPYGPADQNRVEAGRTYIIPARHDPYDLVADGPSGMEFIVAVASRNPFVNLPWYLTNGAPAGGDGRAEGDDGDLESGVIVGDPYVGMERLNRRIIPPGGEAEMDVSETYFYIEKRVEYPRYVCADCHYSSFAFDPYLTSCSVVDIRIDATWVRYAPVRSGVARPRYYYWVRPTAPDRYRAWKERWSSIDGGTALRSRFVVERSSKSTTSRDVKARRQPPEFQDLRRTRTGRLWEGRDEVLRLGEKQRGGGGAKPPAVRDTRVNKDRSNVERRQPEKEKPVERGGDQSRPKDQDRARERDPEKRRDDQGKVQERDKGQDRDKGQERDKGQDRDKGQERDKGQDRDKSQDRDKGQDRNADQSQKERGVPPKSDAERRERTR